MQLQHIATFLVIGGTGSGKTTLVNAIIHRMVGIAPNERVVIIEGHGRNPMCCSKRGPVSHNSRCHDDAATQSNASDAAGPDSRWRGARSRVLDLLMAWNTGHEGGAATLHANNARAGLDKRLAMLISMNRESPRIIEPLIAEAVHVLIHIARTPAGRRIEEILSVCGFRDGLYQFKSL